MSSNATAMLVGRLGADPEVRDVNGNSVCKFRVCTNKKRGQEELATWWGISAWGRQGESCAKYLVKGRLVSVVGEAYIRKYTDRNGVEKQVLEIDAHNVTFISEGRPSDEGRQQPQQQQPQQQQQQQQGGGWQTGPAPQQQQQQPQQQQQQQDGGWRGQSSNDEHIPF